MPPFQKHKQPQSPICSKVPDVIRSPVGPFFFQLHWANESKPNSRHMGGEHLHGVRDAALGWSSAFSFEIWPLLSTIGCEVGGRVNTLFRWPSFPKWTPFGKYCIYGVVFLFHVRFCDSYQVYQFTMNLPWLPTIEQTLIPTGLPLKTANDKHYEPIILNPLSPAVQHLHATKAEVHPPWMRTLTINCHSSFANKFDSNHV